MSETGLRGARQTCTGPVVKALGPVATRPLITSQLCCSCEMGGGCGSIKHDLQNRWPRAGFGLWTTFTVPHLKMING